MDSLNQKPQWWTSFFSGLITDVQTQMYSPEQTQLEATFINEVLALPQGAVVADVPSGDGRLSISLSKYGYQLKGLDISPEITQLALQGAKAAGVQVEFQVGDMKNLPWTSQLDGAFCFGNSFAYFNDEGNLRFLNEMTRSLKPGGRFLLQSNLVVESILAKAPARSWFDFGDITFLHSPSYDPMTSTLNSEYTLIRGDKREVKRAHYRVYPLKDLMAMLEVSGLKVIQVFGGLKKESFKLGDPAVYVLTEK